MNMEQQRPLEVYLKVRVGTPLAEVQRLLIEETVRQYETKRAAAKALGICTKTLYNFLRKYEEARRRPIVPLP